MLGDDLRTLLAGVAGGRAHPLAADQPTGAPYVTYQRVAVVPNNTVQGNGDPGLWNSRIQIDVFAKTYAEAEGVAGDVRAALQGWAVKNVQLSEQDLYEPDTKLYRVLMEFSVWHATP